MQAYSIHSIFFCDLNAKLLTHSEAGYGSWPKASWEDRGNHSLACPMTLTPFRKLLNSHGFLGAQHRNETEKAANTDAGLALEGVCVWGGGGVRHVRPFQRRFPLPYKATLCSFVKQHQSMAYSLFYSLDNHHCCFFQSNLRKDILLFDTDCPCFTL